jgi:hypothetical protein
VARGWEFRNKGCTIKHIISKDSGVNDVVDEIVARGWEFRIR